MLLKSYCSTSQRPDNQSYILDAEKGVMMNHSFPNESTDYRAARNQLLQREIELRRITEAVAQARRKLPPGGIVAQDYIFRQAGPGGTPTEVRMSELFVRDLDTLVIYNFMFPRALNDEGPCPSCTSMLDGLDGAVQHIRQRINFAVVAKTPVSRLLAHAHQRGWRWLQLLSSASNTYNRENSMAHGSTKSGYELFNFVIYNYQLNMDLLFLVNLQPSSVESRLWRSLFISQ
jgi:predicted dithiol-disulfide oxidoreductase (DUF899 family)